MISRINKIHGSSSQVIFECEDISIKANGEFLAEDSKIIGFIVSKASLMYVNGKQLTSIEQEELICQYEEYVRQPHIQKNWILRFE